MRKRSAAVARKKVWWRALARPDLPSLTRRRAAERRKREEAEKRKREEAEKRKREEAERKRREEEEAERARQEAEALGAGGSDWGGLGALKCVLCLFFARLMSVCARAAVPAIEVLVTLAEYNGMPWRACVEAVVFVDVDVRQYGRGRAVVHGRRLCFVAQEG